MDVKSEVLIKNLLTKAISEMGPKFFSVYS